MEIVYSKDGTRIACERTGEGPALVHVGGALRVLDGQTHDVAPEALAPVLAEFLA
ncbi:hypothetical protein [Actinomadura monticuli]|uniref:DUF397 domain-containing protein n=1 Tax=Actinomadura monticuli TaxID=3097367 RepID=A0ABV4QKL8_9ACTN